MNARAARLMRPAYERAGEYRRPSMRAKPLTEEERAALLASCTVPPHRWSETSLQSLPGQTHPYIELAGSKPGQLVSQPQAPSPAAPPTVLTPIAAEDNPAPAVPRVATTIPTTPLSDLARATLERYRKRYCL